MVVCASLLGYDVDELAGHVEGVDDGLAVPPPDQSGHGLRLPDVFEVIWQEFLAFLEGAAERGGLRIKP